MSKRFRKKGDGLNATHDTQITRSVKNFYNIARIFTQSNLNSASVLHNLIEHANDVNKLTVQCSAVFLLFKIWKKPAKNCPIFLSALTF